MAHVSVVIPSLTGAGSERKAINISCGLISRGHYVDIVLFEPIIDFVDDVPPSARIHVLCGRSQWEHITNIPSHVDLLWQPEHTPHVRLVPMCARLLWEFGVDVRILLRRFDPMRALRLAYYTEHNNPDIIFAILSASETSAYFARRLAISKPFPPIVSIVGNWLRPDSRQTQRRKLMFPDMTHVVAVSHGVRNSISQSTGVGNSKLTTIYNPIVSTDLVSRSKLKPNHPWFFDGGPPIILGAGRLVPQKDFPTLIEAFRLALRVRPLRLIILGEGQMRRELEMKVRLYNLVEHISLPGWSDNPYAFMSRAALFVLSSRHEGFGNVIVEALACGCPVVSTDCQSGPAEIVDDPTVLVPVGDAPALSEAMLKSLGHIVDKSLLWKRAARFKISAVALRYEELLLSVIDNCETLPKSGAHRCRCRC